MDNFKVNFPGENQPFIVTQSYLGLLDQLECLKNSRGNILHVMGAPGTGKSSNIYQGLHHKKLDYYEVHLELDSLDLSSEHVLKNTLDTMMADLGVVSHMKLMEELCSYDAVLFADQFHDSHFFYDDCWGFSQWTDHKGWGSIPFYFKCTAFYLKNLSYFHQMNLIFQSAWRTRVTGEKQDLFTEMGVISGFIQNILKIPFKVVVINYSPEETMAIVKSHLSQAKDEEIIDALKRFGAKPRFICEYLENL